MMVLAATLYGVLSLRSYTYIRKFQDDTSMAEVTCLWRVYLCAKGRTYINIYASHMAKISTTLYFYLIASCANPLALKTSICSNQIHVFINMYVVIPDSTPTSLIADEQAVIPCQKPKSPFDWHNDHVGVHSIEFTERGAPHYRTISTSQAASATYYSGVEPVSNADSVIDALILYSLITGLLASIFAGVNLILYVTMPGTFVQLAPNFFLGKHYTNSQLTT
ncbi:hypothetical protein BD410DRAFT_801935 [Rickenella mellea]|uniref:DUF6534 domain-containing protein n=1 Tax=Rickenella mellea TaxID=50990 RepID=A0A4Y7QBK4_9AGAM|nr:hypothetical protein BD410DRAFT_801935 [Rickenella mellea]